MSQPANMQFLPGENRHGSDGHHKGLDCAQFFQKKYGADHSKGGKTAVRAPMVSFAKIASGNMSLGCNAFITMMQTAELRNLKYPSDPRDLPRKWALFVEPQMRTRPMVVSEIRSQGSPQMPGVHNHEMVQAVSAYGTD